jgi:hypothetical protein
MSSDADVTITLQDGEIEDIEAREGLVVLVKNYDERDPQRLDGVDERGNYSTEWRTPRHDRCWVACHYEGDEVTLFGPYSVTEAQAFVEGLEFGSDGMSHKTVKNIHEAVGWWRDEKCDEAEILDRILWFNRQDKRA